MNLVTVAALALTAFASSAMAQEQEDEQKRLMREGVTRNEFTRHVASGRSVVLNFVHTINPDCSSGGEPDVRLVKAPEHGAVAIVSGEGFANYAKNNVRSKCRLSTASTSGEGRPRQGPIDSGGEPLAGGGEQRQPTWRSK
jgi:hypothetical protein